MNKNHQEIVKDTSIYVASNYIAQFLGFFISIASKRFLGPAMVGVWSFVKVIMGYTAYATLGTSKAAFREIPYHRGKGDEEGAERVKNEVYTFTLIMSVMTTLGVGLYALFTHKSHSHYFTVGLFYIAAVIILQRIYDYYTTLLRANKRFYCIGQVTILSAALNLAFVFILVKPLKLYGLFLASFLSAALGLAFVYYKTRYRFKLQLSKSGLMKLLNIGIPLLLTGLCGQTIRSIDKILIVSHLGVAALGSYSIGMMAHQYIVGVPNMVAIVLYPRMQERYGKEGNAAGVKNFLLKPVLIVGILTCVLTGCAMLGMPWLVHQLLPKFTDGIPAMKILIWSGFFFAIGQQANTFLITLDKQWRILPILLASAGVMYLSCVYFLRLGWALEGVSLGVVVGAALYNLSLFIYAKKHFETWGKTGLFCFWLMILWGYFYGCVFLCSLYGNEASLIDTIVKLFMFAAFCFPPCFIIDCQVGLFEALRTLLKNRALKNKNKK